MASNIDPTIPIYGSPTTLSVRNNFSTAKTEITAIQATLAPGPFTPLTGGTLTGPLVLANDPTSAMMAATRGYVDSHSTGGGGGIQDAIADGTYYGRRNGAWVKVVDTASMNTAIAAAISTAPYLPIGGGTLTGALAVTGTMTATGIVFGANHIARQSGTNYGGAVSSWDTTNARGFGFRISGSPNNLEWGPSDLAGNLTSVGLTMSATGTGTFAGSVYGTNLVINPVGGRVYLEPTLQRNIRYFNNALEYNINGATGLVWSLTDAGDVTGSGRSTYTSMTAKKPTVSGGFVGSWQTDSGEVGFFNQNNILYFANGNGTGGNTAIRGYLDSTGQFVAYGNIYAYNTDFGLNVVGSFRQFQWAAGWLDQWHTSTGMRYWTGPANTLMSLDVNGGLSIYGGSSGSVIFSLLSNSGATPNKYIRVNAGRLDFVNSAFSTVIASLTDVGLLTVQAGLDVTTGNIRTIAGNISAPAGFNVTAGNAVLGDHIWAFRSGTFGGAAGSWETSTGKAFGVRVNAPDGSGMFGPFDAATGNVTTTTHVMYVTGDFQITGATATKAAGTAWAVASDLRTKIVLGNYEHGLAEVLALRPIRYTLREDWSIGLPQPDSDTPSPPQLISDAGTEFVGLVAQEVEDIMPEMVSQIAGVIQGKPVDDLRTMDMSALPLALVNAVRQLDARLSALEGATA
jgi:hypothetical protein